MRCITRLLHPSFAVLLALGAAEQSAAAQVLVDSGEYATVLPVVGGATAVAIKAKNSYCCVASPNTNTPFTNLSFSPTIIMAVNTSITATGTFRGSMEPAVTLPPGTVDGNQNDNRLCVTPTISGTYGFVYANAYANEQIQFKCENTTLNGGYNTNGTPINYLECTNTSDSTIVAKVSAVNAAGQTVINESQIDLQPGVRTDFDVHSTVGPNQYGRVFITHDGTKRALKCAMSRYSADLTLRSTLPFEN